MSNVNEIIERLENLAKHAVHCVGEHRFVMSLDDGIALHEAIDLLKEQECATVEPKRPELSNETKAWLDKMDAVEMLSNIADICIDWDGYRTANGLGGLINEIWAYARYGADRLMKEQSQRDYEAATEMTEYCERYEPTYNPEDGSM